MQRLSNLVRTPSILRIFSAQKFRGMSKAPQQLSALQYRRRKDTHEQPPCFPEFIAKINELDKDFLNDGPAGLRGGDHKTALKLLRRHCPKLRLGKCHSMNQNITFDTNNCNSEEAEEVHNEVINAADNRMESQQCRDNEELGVR